ncbi:MAG: hypothetical protein QW403_02655 [Candidatus Aenigmatarchaeota archaeon]
MNEKITRLLLTYPNKKWKQKELVLATGFSKGFISQQIKELTEENIISKLENRIVLTDFLKLLNKWAGTRKLPKPTYFKAENVEKIEEKLRKSKIDYALTLFRAAWHRVKFLKVEKVELYVKRNDFEKIKRILGKEEIVGNIEVYVDDDALIGSEKINGLNLVSVVQNYVDLVCVGGNGTRVAMQLAKKYGLI